MISDNLTQVNISSQLWCFVVTTTVLNFCTESLLEKLHGVIYWRTVGKGKQKLFTHERDKLQLVDHIEEEDRATEVHGQQ